MSFFNKRKEPVFLKESSDARRQLEELKALEPQLSAEGQSKIRKDIKCLEYGIFGEEQIAYELKNSHMPMYILHDIYLEAGGLSAQIDYIVITSKLCFLIECKNLFGNIEINSRGEFIRTMEIGGRKIKEGIYSPITKNERHLELVKQIKVEAQSNGVTRFMTEKYFSDFHKAVVVLANPKTILNDRYAKKEVKEKVIRGDGLIAFIKEQNKQSKELEDSDERMKKRAESFLKLHKEVQKDYTSRYQPFLLPTEEEKSRQEGEKMEENQGKLWDALKAYRWEKSKEEKVKPYFIFNNRQLEDLIAKMPGSKEDLQAISGFGPVKTEKYGEDILRILRQEGAGGFEAE